MKNVKLFFILVTILYSTGCSKKEQPHNKTIDDNIIINIDNATTLNPKENFYEVCCIPLQTSQNSLIGEISKLYITNEYIIVVDQKYNNLLQFNKNGQFIRKIGAKGQGPNEYIMFNDVVFDYDTQKIYAYERYSKTMHVYNLNGELVETINSKFNFNSFIKCDNGFWIYSCFKDYNPDNNILMLVDNNLSTVLKKYFPQEEINVVQFTPRFTINPTDNEKYFYYDGSNIIWRLKDEADEAFNVDFGELVLPYSNIQKAQSIEEYNNIIYGNKYLGFINNLFISDSSLYFTCTKSELNKSTTLFNVEYDRNNRTTHIYKSILNIKDFIPANYSNLLLITPENELVYAIEPHNLYSDKFERLKERFKDISEDNNPILLFVKKQNNKL